MQVVYEKEAESFLEKEGFPTAKRGYSKTLKGVLEIANEIGYPVALKISSHKILHKSDVGGVKLDLRNEKEVSLAFQQISKIKGFEQAMVEEFNEGHFLLLGIKKDQTFGHVIAVGSGGIYTEIFKDISFRVAPLKRKDAEEMLKEIKLYPTLLGTRGQKPANVNNIIDLILKLSNLTEKHPNIKELDINPLLVNDKKCLVIDARMVLE